MKKLVAIAFCTMLFSLVAGAREQRNINNNWLFASGNETEYTTPDFDDSGWKKVSLPYDWSLDSDEGKGCYRYHFTPKEYEDRLHFSLRFDGLAGFSRVYVNGARVGESRNAYLSSVFDITPFLNFGADNVITVMVDCESGYCSEHEGSGIFRNVFLISTESVFVPPFATRVWTNFGKVYASTSVSNMNYLFDDGVSVFVKFNIMDASGRVLDSYISDSQKVPQFGNAAFNADMHISIPHMWELDDPYMYMLETVVYSNGEVVDNSFERFGVRDVVFDVGKGLVLNNRRVAIHGVRVPQEHYGVGSAIPDELWRYRLEKLKRTGVDVITFGQNPASPAVLDLCDEIGLMVIEENNEAGAGEAELTSLRNIVKRDFNHPSVIMWCVGEESNMSLPGKSSTKIVSKMTSAVKSADVSRPVVFGYSGADQILQFNQPTFIPEAGVFDSDEKLRSVLDYYEANRNLSGMIFESGFDTRDPECHNGLFDYRGFPKDAAFLLQSAWTWNQALHIGGLYDGKIWVYTNCSSVALSVNGKNLGTKVQSGNGCLSWSYTGSTPKRISAKGSFKGTLAKAINIKSEYKSVPSSTSVEFSKTTLKGDGQDMVVLDIFSAKPEILVAVSGPVSIIGSEAGTSSVPAQFSYGKAQLLLRSIEGGRGQIKVMIDGKEYLLSCN